MDVRIPAKYSHCTGHRTKEQMNVVLHLLLCIIELLKRNNKSRWNDITANHSQEDDHQMQENVVRIDNKLIEMI